MSESPATPPLVPLDPCDPSIPIYLWPKVPDEDRPKRCEHCPYGGICVGTRGPVDSPFVIVGESPGSNELLKGYPFVGDSGELLDAALEKVGLTRDDPQPYIVNAIQCMPRGDKQSTLGAAVSSCQARMWAEIGKYPRKVIVALGNGAMWSITGNQTLKITQERGKLWKTPLAEIGCVTAVHPAYLMRNGTAYGAWRRDLEYAVALLKGTDPKAGHWAPPLWATIKTRDELEALVNRMEKAKYIAADTETGGKKGAGLNFQKGFIIMLTLTSDLSNGRYVDVIPGALLWENEDLVRRLMGNKAQWIWQNGKFDVKWYRYEGIPQARVDHDTMLASYALNENKGHDLDTIAWDWIGAPKHKDGVDNWFAERRISRKNRNYADIPFDFLAEYAAKDTSKTYKMFWPMYEMICADKHTTKLYHQILIPASEFLTQVEMNGLELDLERVVANDAYLLDALNVPATKIQAYAMQYLGYNINIGSPQQLQVLLYDKMKLGASGSSTDDDHLTKIQRRHDHPIATNLKQWRTISKARNTYVKNAHEWPGLDNRVHITYKIHGTSTGRLSSGDPTNLQNWPRDPNIRGEFVAARGKVLVEVDLNQAELRSLALMSGDPTLLDIYTRNEVSIHHITSLAMFGEGYTDDQKMRAKAVNFGIVYGRTAPSLAEEFDISLREAEEYIRVWFARYPVARAFIDDCREAPNKMRNLITNFGRKKRWGVISYDNQRNSENESANFPHQSTAHDITLLSGIECQPAVKAIWDGDFVNEIHDALYIEVDDDPDVYGPMICYLQSVMTRIPKDWGLTRVPFIAEAKVGTRWGGRKNAKDIGITDPELLAQYMGDFKPTEEHQERMLQLIGSYKEHEGTRFNMAAVATLDS